MRKDIEWLKDKTQNRIDRLLHNGVGMYSEGSRDAYQLVLQDINELDEPEVLSQEWIDENKVARINNLRKITTHDVVSVDKLKNLLVPKQEEVDQAYKAGYEKGKEHTTEKERETVGSVFMDFLIASAKLKLALSMEVEELEE